MSKLSNLFSKDKSLYEKMNNISKIDRFDKAFIKDILIEIGEEWQDNSNHEYTYYFKTIPHNNATSGVRYIEYLKTSNSVCVELTNVPKWHISYFNFESFFVFGWFITEYCKWNTDDKLGVIKQLVKEYLYIISTEEEITEYEIRIKEEELTNRDIKGEVICSLGEWYLLKSHHIDFLTNFLTKEIENNIKEFSTKSYDEIYDKLRTKSSFAYQEFLKANNEKTEFSW